VTGLDSAIMGQLSEARLFLQDRRMERSAAT
jgi:hypothetical protein